MQQEAISLKTLLGKLKSEFGAGLGFSFFINILMLVSPIFMLQAYDRVLPSRSELTLLMLLILAIFLLIVMGGLDSLRYRLMSKTASKFESLLAPNVFSSVIELNRAQPNTNANVYFQDISNIKQFVGGSPICCFFDAPWVPLFILCNYLIHPLLGTITLLGALIIFAIAYVNERSSRQTTEKSQQTQANAQQYVADGMAQLETLNSMGITQQFEKKWLALQTHASAFSNLSNIQSGSFSALTKSFRLCLQTLILGAGCWLAIDQSITPGAMIAASIIMGRALAPVEQAIGSWRVFVKARSAYSRIDKLLLAFPKPEKRIKHERPEGHLHADKLIVVPPESDRPVLKGLSFKIRPGDRLAVMGASGSGKSTLGRVLAGIWSPRSGSVKLDGVDLRQWNDMDLGEYIGYLSQNVEFLPGTIAQNISRFQECEDVEILNAAKLAGVHQQITQLKDGYDTQLSSNAAILSAGQKQLVGLARAVFRKPSLIILDEPNAHLDRQGDLLFTQLLDRLKDEKTTCVVISHKENILAHVDYYLEIKMGQTAVFCPASEAPSHSSMVGVQVS